MREGMDGQKLSWMGANNVGESISDTCEFKNPTHLLRLQ